MSGLLSISVAEARGLVAAAADIDKLTVVMGCASTAVGLSPFYLSSAALIAGEGYGDAVDTAAQIIEQVQPTGGASVKLPCALYTCTGTTAGSYGTIDVSGVTGTSVVSNDSSVHPYGTYEAYLLVTTGGTIGSPGIVLTYSLDNGRTTVAGNALGSATSYTIPNSNVKFAFAAGTLVAGDIVRVRTKAPAPVGADITAAFAALAASTIDCSIVVCEWPMTASLAAYVSTGLAAMRTAGKRAVALCRTRIPDAGTSETDAAWNTAVATDFVSFTDSGVLVRAAYGIITDAVTSRQYLRSDLAQFAADVARVSIEQIPNVPADRKQANTSLILADGTQVGHDEGPRGSSTGLSDTALGNRFSCAMRLPNFSRREDVYSCIPWVMYAADERIRTLPARRIVNSMERTAIEAGTTTLGGIVRYNAAVGTQPATLTESQRIAIQGVIFGALSKQFGNIIQNARDASVDTGLVQVSPSITVSAGGIISIAVTIAPFLFGYLQSISLTIAVQE